MNAETIARVMETITTLDIVWPSTDGDCITVSARLYEALAAVDVDARLCTVTGTTLWLDGRTTVLAFMHTAVMVDDRIVDCTATQFDPGLPHVMVLSPDLYCATLGKATGTTVRVAVQRDEGVVGNRDA